MKKIIYAASLLITVLLSGCDEDTLKRKPLKLDYYIESYQISTLDFEPQIKVKYDYQTSGELNKYTVFTFDPDSRALVQQRHFEFSYANGLVDKIAGFLPGAPTPYVTYAYEYVDTVLSTITEQNVGTGINSEAHFVYNDHTAKVSYTFSNGGSFEYEFDYLGKNILTDKTTKGAQVCNEGQYTYDDHVNPFNMLGYIDYLLTNLSVNNKLTENVNYLNCGFPTLVPVSYQYQYNKSGYPTLVTTSYSSGDFKSRKEIFYK